MASLIAAGYVLGSDSIGKAREFDEKHSITQQIKAKVDEVDKALHISETAAAVKTAATEKAKEVDQQLQISAKANAAADAVSKQASAIATKVGENEVVSKGVGILKGFGATISNSVQNLKDESSRAIDEKRAEKGQMSPAAASAEQHTVSSPVPANSESAAALASVSAANPQ
eukprot:TRINITY_DN3771_c0_g1_i2.p1 TRINITY_DN3771_c0_g1~~TRINITY_DN3771_c0_g1_i2.p1  ORF type:complete len:172 (+),score=99.48 TRINITY_DN3771_c0_g1_i2:472-987(+)